VSVWAVTMTRAALAVDRAAFGLAEQADRDLVFAVGEIVRGLPEPEGWAEPSRRIADLEGALRYLRTQAAAGSLHPEVVIHNVDFVLGRDGEAPASSRLRSLFSDDPKTGGGTSDG